jgi:hypothetical protein
LNILHWAQVRVRVNGEEIKGSGFKCTVIPNQPHSCDVLIGPSKPSSIAGDFVRFGVIASDRYGNICEWSDQWIVEGRLRHNVNNTVEVMGLASNVGNHTDVNAFIPESLSEDADAPRPGVILSFTPTNIGTYSAFVFVNGQALQTRSPQFLVQPNAADAKCCVVNDLATSIIAGSKSSAVIITRDRYSNPCDKGRLVFEVTVQGPTSGGNSKLNDKVEVLDVHDGRYRLVWTPQVAGDYKLFVTLNGEQVRGCPFGVIVKPDVVFVPNCVVTGLPTSKVCAGTVCDFDIVTRDRFSNVLSTASDKESFQVWLEDVGQNNKRCIDEVHVFNREDGRYQCKFATRKSGQFDVVVGSRGKTVQGSPYRIVVEAGPPCAAKCIITGNGTIEALAGTTASFTIQCRDEFSNDCEHGGALVQAELKGPDTLSPSCRDHGDGTYTLSYVATVAGAYRLSCMVDAMAVVTVFDVQIKPAAANAAFCSVDGTGLSHAIAGQRASFSIVSRDRFSNVLQEGPLPYSCVISGVCKVDDVHVEFDEKSGLHHVSYQANVAGNLNITVRLRESTLLGCPFQCAVAAGTMDVLHCKASGPGLDSVTIVDIATTFIIRSFDSFGNLRTQGGDKFVVKYTGPQTFMAQIHDNLDGTYNVTCKPSESGDYTIEIVGGEGEVINGKKVAPKPIGGSPFTLLVLPDMQKWAQYELEKKAKREIQKVRARLSEVRDVYTGLKQEVLALPAEIGTLNRVLDTKLREQEATVKLAKEMYRREIMERRRLHNVIQELRGNIRVFCRVRPSEDESTMPLITFPFADNMILINPESVRDDEFGTVERAIRRGYAEEGVPLANFLDTKRFAFDRVLLPQSTQPEVFEAVEPLITSVLDGYNVCVFAYGQTGSGKTHTMVGPNENPGICSRSITQLFHVARQERGGDWRYTFSVSLLEIYNEQVCTYFFFKQ